MPQLVIPLRLLCKLAVHQRPHRTRPSVVAGLAYNLFAALNGKGFGQALPWFVDLPVEMLSRGFSPCVLFLAGAATFGSFTELGSVRSAALPALLVLLKSLVLPFSIRALLHLAGRTDDETNFGFICDRSSRHSN